MTEILEGYVNGTDEKELTSLALHEEKKAPRGQVVAGAHNI